jgi:hypothetical protein
MVYQRIKKHIIFWNILVLIFIYSFFFLKGDYWENIGILKIEYTGSSKKANFRINKSYGSNSIISS